MGYRAKYSTASFFRKRFSRVILPFILWSAIYLFYNSFVLHQITFSSFKDIMSLFLDNKIVGIFYFFYCLMGIYLIVPVTSILADARYKKLIQYVILVGFLGTMVRRDFSIVTKLNVTGFFDIPLATGYMCFFICGWYLFNYDLKSFQRKIIYILGSLSFAFMFGFTFIRSYQLDRLYDSVRSYISISNLFMAISIFVLVKNINFEKLLSLRMINIIKNISSASLGVYLIQMLFFPVLWKYFNTNSIPYMLIAPILLYTFCVAVVLIAKKIPVIKAFFP